MKTKHIHNYRKGRGSVDVCDCGRFRHNETAGPAIVEQTVETEFNKLFREAFEQWIIEFRGKLSKKENT